MRPIKLVIGLVLLATLCACASTTPRKLAQSSSVVNYLYPDTSEPPALTPGLTVLNPPVKVGIAFVPDGFASGPTARAMNSGVIAETEKMKLLERVKAAFANHPRIGSIEMIPTAYLRPRGGFANLQQAAQMFNVDVVALVSYDQIQFSDTNSFSVLYWTIVGAYVVHGDRYDVQTLLDISIFDVKSRRLLMRVPGQSQVKGSASMASFSENARNARIEGFGKAVDEAIPALAKELEAFRERIKTDAKFKVEEAAVKR